MVESMLTSNKRLEDFIYLNKIKTEILNPDWLKKGEIPFLKCLSIFRSQPFSQPCYSDFSIGARALSTEAQIEE